MAIRPHQIHRYSKSQNLRKKSKSNTNNEKSKKKVVYSNNYIKEILDNPVAITERKSKNNSIKNFIHNLVNKEVSKKTLNEFPSYQNSTTTKRKKTNNLQKQKQVVKMDQK